MTLYANKSKLEEPHLREGDLIYLLRRNIKITRPSDKLDLKKIGLFKIKRNIRDISFELSTFYYWNPHTLTYQKGQHRN
jgi:hypothetical protein